MSHFVKIFAKVWLLFLLVVGIVAVVVLFADVKTAAEQINAFP